MALKFLSISQPMMHKFYNSLCPSPSSHDNLNKMNVYKNPDDIQVCSKYNSIISKHCCFGSAITWLQINKTSQVGGVLESSGHPLDVGHYKSHIDYLRLTLG